MKAYSVDLRERIVAAVESGAASQGEVATLFSVTRRFVSKILRQKRERGHIEPLPHGGGHWKHFDAADEERLRQEVEKQPDVTLAELRRRVHPRNQKRRYAHLSTIGRTLKALGLRRKKKDGSAIRSR